MKYLNRDANDFSSELWEKIDQTAVVAARDVLTARRFLEVEGPYGVGLTSVETGDETGILASEQGKAAAVTGCAVAVPMLQQMFELSIRRVEGHLQMGLPLDLRPVEDAAEAVALREEEIIYHGIPDHGLHGLMVAKDRAQVNISAWDKVEDALENVLRAVNRLDDNGFRGPYALVLSPSRYNSLFRRYEGSDMLQLDHLRRLCEAGVFKAPIEGGALIDPRAGTIKIGQDLQVGYSGNDGVHYKLFANESLLFQIDEPQAICTLDEG